MHPVDQPGRVENHRCATDQLFADAVDAVRKRFHDAAAKPARLIFRRKRSGVSARFQRFQLIEQPIARVRIFQCADQILDIDGAQSRFFERPAIGGGLCLCAVLRMLRLEHRGRLSGRGLQCAGQEKQQRDHRKFQRCSKIQDHG